MIFTASLIALVASLPVFASPIPELEIRAQGPGSTYNGALITSGRNGKCLNIESGVLLQDQFLNTVDCSKATRWNINLGSGSILVSANPGYAVDAGLNPHNNVRAKIYSSYPGAPQQTWYLTNDNRIAITGGDQCLDEGDSYTQTYQCTPGNTNQVWYVGYGNTPAITPFSSQPAPTPTTTSKVSASSTFSYYPQLPSVSVVSGTQLRWQSDQSKCLTLTAPPADNVPVELRDCANPPFAGANKFQVYPGGDITFATTDVYAGAIKYCLDTGSNPSSGTGLKIYRCGGPSWPQQQFKHLDASGKETYNGAGVYKTANNQCIDIDNSNYRRVQTWTCSQSDPNQIFLLGPQFV